MTVKLEDVCDISSGGTPSRGKPHYYAGEIPWAKISDIENAKDGIITETEEHISSEGLRSIGNRIFPKGTLLFAMYGSIGKVAITGRELATNQAILGIRPKSNKEIHLPYLKVWFERNKQNLISQGRGVALQNLSATIVRNLKVPLPPHEDQIRIANVLSNVESLISQRNESLCLLDELLKSTFLEMFGDPERNEKHWSKPELKEVARVKIGPFGSLLHFEDYVEGGIPLVNPSHIINGKIEIDNTLTVSEVKIKELAPYRMKVGDLVLGRRGEIGRCAVVTKAENGFLCGTGSMFLTPSNKLNPTFLYFLISSSSIRKRLEGVAKGITMKNLNSENLESLSVIVPDIDVQIQFAQFVGKIEALKASYLASLQELENLYGALSQLAFNGQLDLTKVPFQGSLAPIYLETEPRGSLAPEKVESLSQQIQTSTIGSKTIIKGKISFEEFLAVPKDPKEVAPYNLYQLIIERIQKPYFTFEEVAILAKEGLYSHQFERLKEIVFELLRSDRLKQAFTDASFKSALDQNDTSLDELNKLPERMHFYRPKKK